MNRRIYQVLSVLMCVLLFTYAQVSLATNQYKVETYQSYMQRNFTSWPHIIEQEQKYAFSSEGTFQDQVNTMVDYYGYIGSLLDDGNKDDASEWLEKAQKVFKRMVKQYPKEGEMWALYSMFTSLEIAISPLKAGYLARTMFSTVDQAKKFAPHSMLTQLAQANIYLYFPKAFGGNIDKSILIYKAIYEQFSKDITLAKDEWLYLSIMSTISFAYEKKDDIDSALVWANTALSVAPNFVFVKEELLPRLRKKSQG